MYKCNYFSIKELVPPSIYSARGERAWELLDTSALLTLDALRERFGRTTVNTWHKGGDRKWSGLRTADSPYYSPTSQHTFGRAFDCLFLGSTAQEVRDYIYKNKSEFPYITGIEEGVNWLHFDTRNSSTLKVFRP